MKLRILSLLTVGIIAATVIHAQNVSVYAGTGETGYTNGTLLSAKFKGLEQMAYDIQGNLYVCDAPNHCIRKIDTKGNVTTFAGTGEAGLVNGDISVAQFNNPLGIAIDKSGNVYVSDNVNFVVRKIDTKGYVSTYAGNGQQGYTDGIGSASQFSYVNYMCIDDENNLYVADPDNNVIRKIDKNQNVSTFVGSGKVGFKDGIGASSELSFPIAIAYDKINRVFYVSDQGNSAIRKVQRNGTLTTYAGIGTIGHTDGKASEAKFYFPKGITVDNAGNVYVAGRYDYTVRKIDMYGTVSTVAGFPHTSGNNDGVGNNAKFGKPIEVITTPEGNLLVSDWANAAIRKIELPATPTTVNAVYKNQVEMKVIPNPVSSSATIKVNGLTDTDLIQFLLYDVTGKEVTIKHTISGTQISIERENLNSGIYFYKVMQNDKVIGVDKLIIQ